MGISWVVGSCWGPFRLQLKKNVGYIYIYCKSFFWREVAGRLEGVAATVRFLHFLHVDWIAESNAP